jgi:hypothetical protein
MPPLKKTTIDRALSLIFPTAAIGRDRELSNDGHEVYSSWYKANRTLRITEPRMLTATRSGSHRSTSSFTDLSQSYGSQQGVDDWINVSDAAAAAAAVSVEYAQERPRTRTATTYFGGWTCYACLRDFPTVTPLVWRLL